MVKEGESFDRGPEFDGIDPAEVQIQWRMGENVEKSPEFEPLFREDVTWSTNEFQRLMQLRKKRLESPLSSEDR